MKKTIRLTESDLMRIVKKTLSEQKSERYMFFSNLEQMRKQCDLLLDMDHSEIESILTDGHDWAQDHVAEAKNNLDQVFDFLMNETKRYHKMSDEVVMEGRKKNVPTNPSLWKKSLNWAKSRYEVCPSAYCNGAAAKRYKNLGGKWKKK